MDAAIEIPEDIKQLKLINVSVRNNVVIVSYNNPYSKVNSYSSQCNQEVVKVFNFIGDNQKLVRGTVVTSSKVDNFFAGVDIKELDSWSPDYAYFISQKGQEVLRSFHHFSKPSVAVIMGSCLGAGFELANSCHYKIAVDVPSTVIGLPEVLLGLIPGATGTVFTPRRLNFSTAVQMMLSGKTYSAKKAKEMGLVDEIISVSDSRNNSKMLNGKFDRENCESNQILNVLNSLVDIGYDAIERMEKGVIQEKALSWSEWFFLKSLEYEFVRNYVFGSLRKEVMKKTRGLYRAPLELLHVIETSFRDGIDWGLQAESDAFKRVFESDEHKSLRKVFNNQMHCKKNHYAKDVNGTRSRSGSEINANSIPMSLDDVNVELITDKVSAEYEEIVNLIQSKGINVISEDDKRIATDANRLKILCSSYVRPKEADVEVAMHFFPSTDRSPLVEVVTCSDDDRDDLTSRAIQIALNSNKIVITSKDDYYTTRLSIVLICEAIEMILCPQLETSLRGMTELFKNSGFSVDIFRQVDELGLDVLVKMMDSYKASGRVNVTMKVTQFLNKMVDNNMIGIKSSKGFYKYTQVSSSIGVKFMRDVGINKDAEDIVQEFKGDCKDDRLTLMGEKGRLMKDRLILSVINEALLCYQKEIVRSHIEGDVGAVYGIAFPPLLVGPFYYVDKIGKSEVAKKIDSVNSGLPFLDKLTCCQLLYDETSEKFYS